MPSRNTTLKYIPLSTLTGGRKKGTDVLTPLGIAGVVIAGIVVLAVCVVAGIGYLAYARRGYYTKQYIQLASTQFVIEDDEPTTEIQQMNAPSFDRDEEVGGIQMSGQHQKLSSVDHEEEYRL